MEKNKVTKINQRELIKELSNRTGYFQTDINNIFDALEEYVINTLLSTQNYETKKIKLFNGLTLCGEYVPPRVMANSVVSSIPLKTYENIKVSAKFTHGFKERIKNLYRQTKGII